MKEKLQLQNVQFTEEIISYLDGTITTMKNHINYIYSNSTDENIKKYIQNMFQTDIEFYKHIKTGNTYIDTVLIAKNFRANFYKISIDFDIYEQINKLEDEPTYKLVSILDEFLNDCILDFVAKYTQLQNKKISICIKSEGDKINITVSNSLNKQKNDTIILKELIGAV